jgi:hypothetical protein
VVPPPRSPLFYDMIGPPRPPPPSTPSKEDDDGFGFNRLPLSNKIVLRGHTKVIMRLASIGHLIELELLNHIAEFKLVSKDKTIN